MRSRCAATFATFSQSNSSASSTSLTIAGMPLPRNTHSTTISCRPSSTIMSATPNAYWRTCSMRWNHTVDQVGRHALHLVVLLVLRADPHILSIHGLVLREAADRSSVCGSKCAETTATLTPSDISTHSTRPHKRAVSWGREARRTAHARGHKKQQRHPRRTATKSLAHIHTNDRNERGAAHPNPRRCSLLLSSPTDWHCVPHSQ
ncbi:unspecified product [Trypanosoma cruzi Dm28c]|uniref:Unspecified product n=1 Tax=Trypanosoma cruzi Dm28c TaxID=1416333 RepID=V5AMF7_TRYCR|nr:unspecified product [Trypanosoma cruzi Dm28c]